jgi:hypothetical protein
VLLAEEEVGLKDARSNFTDIVDIISRSYDKANHSNFRLQMVTTHSEMRTPS